MSLKISMTLESYDKQHVGREEDFRCALHRGLLSGQNRPCRRRGQRPLFKCCLGSDMHLGGKETFAVPNTDVCYAGLPAI